MRAPILSNEDRELLRASVRRLLETRWGLPRKTTDPCTPHDGIALSQELARLGLNDLGHREGSGGIAELFIAMEELGRVSCPADMLAGILISESVLADDDGTWIRQLRDGSIRAASILVPPGVVKEQGSTLNGEICAAEIFPGSTHIVVAGPSGACFIVSLQQPGVQLEPQCALGDLAVFAVHLTGASVSWRAKFALDGVTRARSLVRGASCARALGATRRAFDVVTAYAKERRQFGRQIGSFQAVQHKLANCHIAIEGISELLMYSAQLRDTDRGDWPFFMDCAFAHAANTLPGCILDIQHTFGAIGYAEEHEAPRHFRRIHWDMLAAGGRRSAHEAVTRKIVAAGGMPDRPLDPEAEEFRREVRDWLSKNWAIVDRTAELTVPFHLRDRNPEFARKVGANGWASLTWPLAFGGQGRPVAHQLVLVEEMERSGAPRFGAPIHAAAIMAFGSPDQQAEHLERIRAGDGIYGIAYSEPDSGSDLASIRTTAHKSAEGWVINGQKIWTTTYWGEHMWVLARTDPAASPPQAGLSLFLLRTDTPGVTICPADAMYGGKFANIFFDDVRLPGSALIGARNDAWRILNVALSVERTVIGGGILGRVLESFDEFVRAGQDSAGAKSASALIGGFGARIAVGQALAERSARAVDSGRAGLVAAAACKVFCSELAEQFFEEALQWGGQAWALSEGPRRAAFSGKFEQRLRHSLMHVISGGTNDIQRSIIACRGLGLPRS